ncbi:hypothetical protein F2Q69_00028939 [Brassica cretica]|uniref:Uncharacterized protein n=1 Tax=Brassica cretica TaxID=69181 RepID=A0A8S9RRF3_BRACR|nr:hypothetical protein F2Q69_00028939 [Brassica cretica]
MKCWCIGPSFNIEFDHRSTTRKHRYSDDKYRRYVLGITVFRGHTDENGRRKFLVGKQSFLGISSENSEGLPRIKDSENIPKKHFLGLFVGISSETFREKRGIGIFRRTFAVGIFQETLALGIFRGSVSVVIFRGVMPSEYSEELRPYEYSEKHLPSKYSEEVYPSGYSKEICLRNIPRKLSSEYPEGYTSSEYSQK